MYLDDITLGGFVAEIGNDLEVMESLAEIELCLNTQKSEIICNNLDTRQAINMMLPGTRLVDPSSSCLLGSPLGDVDCISGALRENLSSLEVMGKRLQHISAHDGILLLRNSFSISKLLYILRTSPRYLSSTLFTYDDVLKSIVSSTTNIRFGDDDPAWLQASLPVRFGGLGFWSAVQIASSAFLASTAASSNLVSQILPVHLQSPPAPYLNVSLSRWSHGHDISPPPGSTACIQKAWDATIVSTAAESLLENAPDDLS